MSSPGPAASQQAVVEAALVLLERMGLSPRRPGGRSREPTRGADVRRVRPGGVGGGERRDPPGVRVVLEPVEHWGDRRLDEIAPSEIRQLMAWVKTHVMARRNARGGRSAQEHLVAALRCLYQRAVEDGLIAEADRYPASRDQRGRCDHGR